MYMCMMVYLIQWRKAEKKVWWWLCLLWQENVYIGLMKMARNMEEKK